MFNYTIKNIGINMTEIDVFKRTEIDAYRVELVWKPDKYSKLFVNKGKKNKSLFTWNDNRELHTEFGEFICALTKNNNIFVKTIINTLTTNSQEVKYPEAQFIVLVFVNAKSIHQADDIITRALCECKDICVCHEGGDKQ